MSIPHSDIKMQPEGCESSGILKPASPCDEILRAVRLLMAPGDVHEVRILKAGSEGTVSGYFDDPSAVVNEVEKYDGKAPAVFITLNPCKPALFARSANRLQRRVQVSTSDDDILRRRWFLIDFDPKRPAGISSTDSEHGRAISVACGAWDDLRGAGFPDPVVGDSGNGAHLLYRIDLPNDPGSNELVKRCLAGIAARCGTDDVTVDLSVFNAARIVKLYGTMACKGDSIPSRPHRRSRLLEVPLVLQTIGATL